MTDAEFRRRVMKVVDDRGAALTRTRGERDRELVSVGVRVAPYLAAHPNASANEVASQGFGRRQHVLEAVRVARDARRRYATPRNHLPDGRSAAAGIPRGAQ
jgi:hypothetical protein